MRVTQKMLNTQLLRNLSNNLGRMEKLQNQMSTGKKINIPSDDPVGISFSLRYRSDLAANEQYQENVDAALSWLEYTDSMMGQIGDVMQRARELAVQGANGTNPDTASEVIAKEISQLQDQLVQIGNSKFNGKYVFNGQMTDVQPFSSDGAALNRTDNGAIRYEVGEGMVIPINLTGSEVFGEAGTDASPNNTNMFQIMQDLKAALETGNQGEVSNILGRIDERMEIFLKARAEVGARVNRIELAGNRLQDISINLQTLISKTEDADMAETITNLKMQENVYQASLSAGARIIQPSLVDFIR